MPRLAPLALLLCAAAAQAQTPPAAPAQRPDQRIERIRVEDEANRIDEVRYGGQAESITVQPKGGLPAYEVDPANLSRSRPADDRNGLTGTGGQRSWNLLRF